MRGDTECEGAENGKAWDRGAWKASVNGSYSPQDFVFAFKCVCVSLEFVPMSITPMEARSPGIGDTGTCEPMDLFSGK